MSNDRKDRFERMHPPRRDKAIKMIALIGNTANSRDYEYTDAEAQATIDALQSEVDALALRFGVARAPSAPRSAPEPAPAPMVRAQPSATRGGVKIASSDPDNIGALTDWTWSAAPALNKALNAIDDGDTPEAKRIIASLIVA